MRCQVSQLPRLRANRVIAVLLKAGRTNIFMWEGFTTHDELATSALVLRGVRMLSNSSKHLRIIALFLLVSTLDLRNVTITTTTTPPHVRYRIRKR
jgi:hypothetical protein